MKKFISLLLVAVMCLTLASCSASDKRDEIRKSADTFPELSVEEFKSMMTENPVRTKELLGGKIYRITSEVIFTTESYCGLDGAFIVHLEKEDILKLNIEECYTFVGTLEFSGILNAPTMKDAILVEE